MIAEIIWGNVAQWSQVVVTAIVGIGIALFVFISNRKEKRKDDIKKEVDKLVVPYLRFTTYLMWQFDEGNISDEDIDCLMEYAMSSALESIPTDLEEFKNPLLLFENYERY